MTAAMIIERTMQGIFLALEHAEQMSKALSPEEAASVRTEIAARMRGRADRVAAIELADWAAVPPKPRPSGPPLASTAGSTTGGSRPSER